MGIDQPPARDTTLRTGHTPHPREPVLRQKTNGAWFVHWGGKDHYLSKDRLIAEKMWADPTSKHRGSRIAWLRWRTARAHAIASTDLHRDPHGPLTVAEVARELLEHYERAGRRGPCEYFRGHLARFLILHGHESLLVLAAADPAAGRFQPPVVPLLVAYRTDLSRRESGLSARTINHDLTAVKRLFNFAADQGYCPPIHWRSVRRMPVPAPEPEELTPAVLQRLFRYVFWREPLLLPYLAINYLTLARPSEVVELVCSVHPPERSILPTGHHRRRRAPAARDPALRGRFLPVIDEHGRSVHPRGLFMLHRHKHSWRSGVGGSDPVPRYLVLTDQALWWLAQARPVWSTLDSYSSACARACAGFGPRMLRDSGASHLRARGADLATVQRLLGHVIDGEWPSYAREPWPAIRAMAARLTL